MEAGEPEIMLQTILAFCLTRVGGIWNRCTANMWALIQYSKDSTAADKVRKLDIDIMRRTRKGLCADERIFSASIGRRIDETRISGNHREYNV